MLATVSWAGGCGWLIVLVLWRGGHRRFAAQLALSLVSGLALTELLKHLFHRARPAVVYPYLINLPLPDLGQDRYSFPSAHSVVAGAFASVVICNCRDWRGWLAVAIAVLIGAARVYQGMHWPSDVAAGWLLGVAAGAIAVRLGRFLPGNAALAEAPGRQESPEE